MTNPTLLPYIKISLDELEKYIKEGHTESLQVKKECICKTGSKGEIYSISGCPVHYPQPDIPEKIEKKSHEHNYKFAFLTRGGVDSDLPIYACTKCGKEREGKVRFTGC